MPLVRRLFGDDRSQDVELGARLSGRITVTTPPMAARMTTMTRVR
jgi:hypothetical protein